MEILLNYKKKKINFEARKCKWIGKIRGLMFRGREKSPALLFDFGKPSLISIHSLFVFFPFVAVWLDDKNKIIEFRKIKPWKLRILPNKRFSRLIEIPCNRKYKDIISFLDGDAKDLNTK